jgi:hypothetical protein
VERWISVILWKGSSDDDALYRCKTSKPGGGFDDATLPHQGKIVIKSIAIRMPIAEYEPNYAIKLRANLLKDPIIPIRFLMFQTV